MASTADNSGAHLEKDAPHQCMMNQAADSHFPMNDALSGAVLGTRTRNNSDTHTYTPPAKDDPLDTAVVLGLVRTQQAAEKFKAVKVALTMNRQAPPFSESLMPSADKNMAGWNG